MAERAGLLVLWWLLLFGMWPSADPGHDDTSLLVWVDLALHVGAGIILLNREIDRRVEQLRSCTEDRFRRSGWRYGYGAGWTDCRNGVYAPESVPPDGRVRSTKPEAER